VILQRGIDIKAVLAKGNFPTANSVKFPQGGAAGAWRIAAHASGRRTTNFVYCQFAAGVCYL
jgi:hypothetical protein